jgi:predicted nucleic acid-binding protein
LPANAEVLLLDTSAAIAYVDPDHPFHVAVRQAVRGRQLGLAGHAQFETFSVLTRLPPPKRQSAGSALRLIAAEFPESRFLEASEQAALLTEFAAEGVLGGAVYDGLVCAAARAHALTLVTCDARARTTYAALGATHLPIVQAN